MKNRKAFFILEDNKNSPGAESELCGSWSAAPGFFLKGEKMENLKKFVGKEFTVCGFNLPRIVKIEDVYFLAGKKNLPAFRCSVIKTGERENFLARDVIRNDSLVDKIKVLSA